MSVTGTINVAEQDDTLIATGTQKILGTLNTEESDDSLTGWGVSTAPYSIVAHDITTITDKSTETVINNYNDLTYVYDETPQTVTNRESVTYVITEGIQGPAGPRGLQGPAGGEDEVALAKRVDFITESLLYKGEAIPGTLNSEPGWRIRRLIIGSDNDVTEEWADGTADYIKTWDNRLTYTYS
jgi:hypothetical protein